MTASSYAARRPARCASARRAAPPTRVPCRTLDGTRCWRSRTLRSRLRATADPDGPDRLTVVPTVMRSGEAFNVVPDAGELLFDMRSRDERRFESAMAAVRAEIGGVDADGCDGAGLACDGQRGGDRAPAGRRKRAARPADHRALARGRQRRQPLRAGDPARRSTDSGPGAPASTPRRSSCGGHRCARAPRWRWRSLCRRSVRVRSELPRLTPVKPSEHPRRTTPSRWDGRIVEKSRRIVNGNRDRAILPEPRERELGRDTQHPEHAGSVTAASSLTLRRSVAVLTSVCASAPPTRRRPRLGARSQLVPCRDTRHSRV